MYQIGDRVVYGMHGVCDVKDLEEKTVDKKKVQYLILEPVSQPGARFLVPLHNPAAMAKVRKMLTARELEALLQSPEVLTDGWIADESQRKQVYRELIGSGDRQRLMSMVHTLYRHKVRQAELGRKVHLCDENFLRDAEKLLLSEIIVVMNLDAAEAKEFLNRALQ